MEVFSVFATLSLVDLISSPLATMQSAMRGAEDGVASFGASMGRLTMGMAPVAIAAGVVMGALGLCVSQAIAFESAMADVAKVVNFDGPAEFQAMSAQVKELAGRIPMAADGIAAIIAAAGQSGVAKNDLAEFAEQAAKMGVAFDLTGDQSGKMMADWRAGMNLTLPQTYALADAVNHLSNNMNATAPALGEVIQRVGAAAMSCGLAETQVASLGAAFLSAGASPEVAATALKSFTTTLVKGTAMSKDQAAAFQGLGFSATQMAKDMQTDAQGTIFKVLQDIADKPKELQMSLLTEMFGQESIGAIAPLLKNMGLLSQAFELTGDAANYAGSMQAEFDARSKTAQNALQLLTNKLNNLAISIGTVFLPIVSWAAAKLGVFVDAVRSVVDNPLGQWLVEMAGGISAAILGVTALSAALWFASAAWPMLTAALAPLKAALLALSWPVLAVIAVLAALYAAYQSNFGGIADYIKGWADIISVVVRGVIAIFQNMTGSTFEIKGELAKEIKAKGLENLVVGVGRIVYRIREFFRGMMDSIGKAMTEVDVILVPVRLAVAELLMWFSGLFGEMDAGIGGAVATWTSFGQAVGAVVGGALTSAAKVLAWLTGVLRSVAETLYTYFVKAVDDGLGGAVAAWTRFGQAVGTVVNGALARAGDMLEWLTGVLRAVGAALSAYYSGVWAALVDGFSGLSNAFQRIWNRLQSVFDTFLALGRTLANAFSRLWQAAAPLFGSQVSGGTDMWAAFGNVVGNIVCAAVYLLATAIQFVLSPLEFCINAVRLLVSLFTGDFAGATEALRGMVASLGNGFAALGDLFGVGDTIRSAWAGIMAYFDSINLFESGAKILMTLADGVKSAMMYPFNAVSEAFSMVRNLLPFSDAKEGPLATLTTSGGAIMTTLSEGVLSKAGALYETVTGALGVVGETLSSWWQKNVGGGAVPQLPKQPLSDARLPESSLPEIKTPRPNVTDPETLAASSISAEATSRLGQQAEQGNTTITIHIGSINLPNAKDAQGFVDGLQAEIAGYGGRAA